MIRRIPLLIGGILMLLGLVPQAAHAQATPVTPVYSLAGNLDSALYAGTECGVYERTGATSWAKTAGLDGRIDDLVRLQDGTLIASSEGWITRRGPGESWQRVIQINAYQNLAVNASGTLVYALSAASVAGISRSDDGGRTWQPQVFPNGTGSPSSALDIAVLPGARGQDTVYAAIGDRRGTGARLFRSTDNGITWDLAPGAADLQRMSGALYTDALQTTLYVLATAASGSGYELYRGAGDAGFETIQLPSAIGGGIRPRVMAYDATLIVAGDGGAFRSTDRGATWQRFDQGIERRSVYGLLYTYHLPIGVVTFAATSSGVFGRSETDQRWSAYSEGLPACNAITPFTPIPPFANSPTRIFDSVTGHSLSSGFKDYYERNGGLPVFGRPLSEEFDERNADLGQSFTTQYFERERFEYHPENSPPYRVLLGRLGAEQLVLAGRDWRAEPETANPFLNSACQQFTPGNIQRSVCGPFLQYWRTHGLDLDGRAGITYAESLGLFGLPLTAPRVETNPDGQTVLTQWFERARFEYYPDNPAPYKVQLGRLGAESTKGR